MSFWRRLRLYLLGFTLGCLLVLLFFGDRLAVLTSWLPQNRVRSEIVAHYSGAHAAADCLLRCMHTDSLALMELVQRADVQFAKSRPREEPRMYSLSAGWNDQEVELIFMLTDSTATLYEVAGLAAQCDCP